MSVDSYKKADINTIYLIENRKDLISQSRMYCFCPGSPY